MSKSSVWDDKAFSIMEAHIASDIDGHGDEGAGYDYDAFAEHLEEFGWSYQPSGMPHGSCVPISSFVAEQRWRRKVSAEAQELRQLILQIELILEDPDYASGALYDIRQVLRDRK